MRKFERTLILILAIIMISAGISYSQSYGWRGPGRSGNYNETGLLKSWPSAGPSLKWEVTGTGNGYSSATVTEDAVYITGRKSEKDVLTSYNQEGKKNWEVPYGNASESNFPDSRCTPTYSNGKIFVISGKGDMVCVGKDGEIIWSVNYYPKYNSKEPQFGISESPLVVDNYVIAAPGGNKAAMVAFNVDNGDVAWETPSIKDGTQYVNPLLIENGAQKIIVTLTERNIITVNSADGKLLWKFNYEVQNAEATGDRNHVNTPIYRDGFILAANGYGQVAVKIKINPDGSEPAIIWKNTDLNPHVGGMVLLENFIYSSTHDTNSKGRWICVDWTTGKTMWITNWHNKGSVISADGMLYFYEEKSGYIGLVKPSSQKLEVVNNFRITKGTGPYWAHPVIDKGRLFVRHGDYLAVYSIK